MKRLQKLLVSAAIAAAVAAGAGVAVPAFAASGDYTVTY